MRAGQTRHDGAQNLKAGLAELSGLSLPQTRLQARPRTRAGCTHLHLAPTRDGRQSNRTQDALKTPRVKHPSHKLDYEGADLRVLRDEHRERANLGAPRVFLSAFNKAYSSRDAGQCMQLVRSFMSALCEADSRDSNRHASSSADVDMHTMPDEGVTPQQLSSIQQAREHLGQLLRGKHQGLMRLLAEEGDLTGAIEYLQMLPPAKTLCSALMKECIEQSDAAGLQRVIKVTFAVTVYIILLMCPCRGLVRVITLLS